MVDLSDTTFLVHYKPDIHERVLNQRMTREFVGRSTEGSRFVYAIEYGSPMAGDSDDLLADDLLYSEEEDVGFMFNGNRDSYHRTKGFNKAMTFVSTPVVFLHDTDVVVAPEFLRAAADAVIKSGGICVAHNGYFLEHDAQDRDAIMAGGLSVIELTDLHSMKIYDRRGGFQLAHNRAVGGCVAVSSEYMREIGECEHFVGWGYEDDFRVQFCRQWKGNGAVGRIDDPKAALHHFPHPTAIRSEHPHYKANEALVKHLQSLTTESQLATFAKTWQRR